jgi:hypothetical protein
MSLNFTIVDFTDLYAKQLLSKEEILNKLNITEYIYKKIIKELNLSRTKTCKLNRFKALNNIEIIKNANIIKNTEPNKINEVVYDNNQNENKINLKEELINEIKQKLDASRKNRNKNK